MSSVRTALSGLVAIVLAAGRSFPAGAQSSSSAGCDQAPFHALDFWVGNWDVLAQNQIVGTNRIEKILGGCAIIENWTDAMGGQGKSLFYYQLATDTWKQVWVTEMAAATGGLKEKRLVESPGGGALRFQGEIPLPKGGTYLDRKSTRLNSSH